MRPGRQVRVVAVPVDCALAFDALRGWHVIAAPPRWWLAEREAEVAVDEQRDLGRHGHAPEQMLSA